MKKILLIGLVLMLIFLTSVLLISSFGLIESFSQKSEFPYTHSHTKAICDENNYCEDYEIFCKDKKVVKMSPTGAAVQYSSNWEDPRDEEIRSGSC
jgi:hypothetical protein